MFEDEKSLKTMVHTLSVERNLEGWSVDELSTYIENLYAEIKRAEAAREDRKKARDGAESLFA